MSGTSFDRIAQEVLKQQQLMQELEGENRELRRQLADLRAGRGIFVEIAGQRFPLEGEMLLPQPVTTSTIAQEDLPKPRTTASLQETPAPIVTEDPGRDYARRVCDGSDQSHGSLGRPGKKARSGADRRRAEGCTTARTYGQLPIGVGMELASIRPGEHGHAWIRCSRGLDGGKLHSY